MANHLYNCYAHAMELIAQRNYPQARDNLELLKECLEKAIELSKDPEKSDTIKWLKIWIKDVEDAMPQ